MGIEMEIRFKQYIYVVSVILSSYPIGFLKCSNGLLSLSLSLSLVYDESIL